MKSAAAKNLKNYPLLTDLVWQSGNSVTVLDGGKEAYPAMLSAINSATHRIWLANYCHRQGRVYSEFQAALIMAAKRGVDVRILTDHHGSDPLDAHQAEALIEAGVKTATYQPFRLLAPWRYNKRFHKKLLIADDTAFTGGVGLADFWVEGSAKYPVAWRDTHFKLNGSIVTDTARAFIGPWNRFSPDYLKQPEAAKAVGTATPIAATNSLAEHGLTAAAKLQLSWVNAAESSITLTTAYFTPTRALLTALKAAAKRGVTVRLICNGPFHTHPIAQRAGQVSYLEALAAGVHIYEYQPTKIHAKLIVVDGRYSIIGSPNLNIRSSYHDEELVLSVDDATIAKSLTAAFERDLSDSKAVTLSSIKQQPRSYRLGNAIRYMLRYFF